MLNDPIENLVSYIPVVFVRALNTSASTGMYSGAAILVASSKKLKLSVRMSGDPVLQPTMGPNPSSRIHSASPSPFLYLRLAIRM